MGQQINNFKSLSGSASTSKMIFRSIFVFLVFIAIMIGYSATQMKQGHSLSIGVEGKLMSSHVETVRGSKIARINRTHNANIEGSLLTPSTKMKENELKDPTENNGYERKSDVNKLLTSKSTKSRSVLSKAKIVLIIAYMRTGSTLTGAIFQSYPGTFYVFEPIRKLIEFFNTVESNKSEQGILKFANGTQRNVSVDERMDMILDELNSWLNCKLTSLDTYTLNSIQHSRHTNIMGEFRDCIIEQEKKQKPNFEGCFDQAIRLCKKAPLRIIKFIRLRIEDAAELLPIYPNMKIIHLIRDPRGVMSSRFKIGVTSKARIQFQANTYCTTVMNDLKTSKEIMSKFPGRLKIVLYEDLAEQPLETSKAMFRFSGLAFNEFVQNFIKNQTSAQQNAGKYKTQRKDSSFTASEWRMRMKFNESELIYKTCLKSNKILGYLPFRSEELLRNLRIASRNEIDIHKKLLKSTI